jgi:UDP-glucose 4-epimerase
MVSGGVGKIIFSSSAAVYGEDKKAPITEEAETRPINPYGWTKLIFEQILKDYDAAGKLKYVALRYFNAGGADPEGELGNEYKGKKEDIISVVIESAQKGKEFKINGDDYPTKDGTCVRDMIHVTDLAKAHVAALNYLSIKMKSDYFNLGSEKGFSVKEIVNKTKEITKKDFKVTVGPSRPGDPAKVIASSLKAKQLLGWKAEMTLEDIIMNAWDWEISQEAQQVQSFK